MKQRLLILTLGLVAATLLVLTAAGSAQEAAREAQQAPLRIDRLGEPSLEPAPASIDFICRQQGSALTRALERGETVAVPLTGPGDADPVWVLVNAELLAHGPLDLDWQVTER